MKKIFFIFVSITFISLISCTKNSNARTWGGTETITLPPGDRLINITWKGQENPSLWILTKKDTINPTTYTFKENSGFGIMEGEITIIEK